MASCTVHTPNEHVHAAFMRLFPFLQRYKLTSDRDDTWSPGVCGYGIDAQCPAAQDTRDNRWLVWAARYCEPDDEFLRDATPSILRAAFTEEGIEKHELAAPYADDYHHYTIWWLLQVALGYFYTGDMELDSDHIRRIVQRLYARFDPEDVGMTHTDMYRFVTSIGEPANTDPGKAYSFYHGCNLAFAVQQFAHLAEARGDSLSRRYFGEKWERLMENLRRFRAPDGFYYALRDVATGEYRYRVTGEEGLCVMSDNVFAPLAFGVFSAEEMRTSVGYLLEHIVGKFPVPYAHPPYRGAWTNGWWIPRSWQEPFAHFCLAMRELEMPSLLSRAVLRMAERFEQDNEVWEHYDPDTGEPEGYWVPPRRGYSTTAACYNIAVIEGLFGIRPAQPGFASVSIRPAFPDDWTFAHIDTTVNGQRIRYTMTREDRRVVYDFSGSTTPIAELCLPLPLDWAGRRVSANIEGVVRPLRGEGRPCFERKTPLPSDTARVEVFL